MKHLICAIALIANTTFVPMAQADEPAGAVTPQQTQAAAKSAYSNKPICKRVVVTGSHVKRTVCKTQEQIDQEKADMDQWAQEISRNSSWSTVSGDH